MILNEVTSAKASVLNGAVEVAGARSHVVIANPSGINLGGASFKNASRVTLTTGTAVLGEDGALQGYDVGKGTIGVATGGYVDALAANYTDLLARDVKVNGFVAARDLNIVGGANQVRLAADGTPQVAGRLQGAAITGAEIDLGRSSFVRLNGDISLVSTGDGLGVRTEGKIAQAENVKVDANGSFVAGANSNLYAWDDVTIKAGRIENAGQLYADRLVLTTPGQFKNTGYIGVDQLAQIRAGSFDGRTGRIASNEGGTIQVDGEYLADPTSTINLQRVN